MGGDMSELAEFTKVAGDDGTSVGGLRAGPLLDWYAEGGGLV